MEVLEVKNILKSFGRIKAVDKVSISLGEGEIMGLVGDNGSGKTTLLKLILGLYKPDEGEIFFEGKKVKFNSPLEAYLVGIGAVYQDLALIDLLRVYENFFLGREEKKRFFLNKELMKMKCYQTLRSIGINLNVTDRPMHMSGGERQSIVVARSIFFGAKLLLWDEPLAALSVKESKKVLNLALLLRARNVSMIIIGHNIWQIFDICDKFIVLSHGRKIAEFDKRENKDLRPETIVESVMR